MSFHLTPNDKEPIYKQLVREVELALHEGRLKAGELLPSMNELASSFGISRETAKKAYGILTDRGVIIPKQGKGFYAADLNADARQQVLVIFDKFSLYKQILFNSFAEHLGNSAQITILNHNQSIELFEYFLDSNLDRFDYYVIAPHFPLDKATQAKALKQIARIPNRKLIMIDHMQPGYEGRFGAVYQDFENDIYSGLTDGFRVGSTITKLRVITLPSSLYGSSIRKGVERFAHERGMPVEFLTSAPEDIFPGDTFLVLNSQLDAGLVALSRNIQACGLNIGTDVRIISYNESDMNELVLGGLTTVSTDFKEMGRLAARMIHSHKLEKIHCPFYMIRRKTF
ncbi:MAG: GntR family transcriptional regulator [Bacteroidales bacterium]|nr:GntR family transcriptional regulator [Bacteroidales bacterium]